MTFPNGPHASELEIVRIVREIARREFAKFWRELAKLVFLFDERSPEDFLANEISVF